MEPVSFLDGLPRLSLCQQTGNMEHDQWHEIMLWVGVFQGDPVLTDCMLSHQFTEFIGEKNHFYDLAFERANQLQETYYELERFGKVVTKDYRILKTNNQPQSSGDRTDSNQKLEDLKQIKWLVDFNGRQKNKHFDQLLANLINSCGSAGFREQYQRLQKVYNLFQRDSNVGRRVANLDHIINGIDPLSAPVPQNFNCKDIPPKNYCND